jgi:uncharacterized membrane protein YfhO
MWQGPLWEAVVRNEGNVFGMTSIPIRPRARPFGHDRYRGEAWITGRKGSAKVMRTTANSVRIAAHLTSPGRLVVNQNYDQGWRAAGLEPEEFLGLLSAKLPAGDHEVLFSYQPHTFQLGAAISLLASTAGLVLVLRTRKRQAQASPS